MDFTRLKRLYNQGRIGREQLEKAVSLGWLTQEQAQAIENEGIDPAPGRGGNMPLPLQHGGG